MLRIGIAGVGGRMGREVVSAALSEPGVELAGGFVRPERLERLSESLGGTVKLHARLPDLIGSDPRTVDVLVEFTHPDATIAIARECAERECPLVSGTTGLSADQLAELRELSRRTPIFYARNMSLGISALLAILPAVVQALEGYDVEIIETHHRHKADAPSGTALALAEAIAAATHRPLDRHAVYGRRGIAPRASGELGIHAVRAGGSPGEHTVLIADEGEEVQVTHRAYSRRTFALGALRAARFLSSQSPGFYTMADLLASARDQ